MATFGGPNIKTDNLVFYYDIDNIKSYRGEPTENIAIENIGFGNITSNGISYQYVGIDSDGWRKYSISGTGNSSTYPYTFFIRPSSILVSTRTSFSFKYKTNVPHKFVGGVYSPRMVNISYASGRTGVDYEINGYRFGTQENVSPASGSEVQYQAIYFMSRPIEGQIFDPSNDFLYFKDVQAERKPHTTPFVNGTRSATQGLLDLTRKNTIDLSNVSFDSDAIMEFDGTDDYFLATSNGISDFSQPFTIEVVMKVPSDAIWTNGYKGTIVTGNDAYDGAYGLVRDTVENQVALYVRGNPDGSASAYYSGLLRDTWYHIIGTWDGTYTNIYVNNDNGSTGDGSAINGGPNNSNVYIALAKAYSGAYGNYFKGKLPVVKYYNKALTEAEIQNNYNHYKNRFNIE